ncbi:MAG: hypothetical protein OQK75_04805 [Gammaproteobacteria bacterium]|nr:hypothetical protein [Gammaproteobacteria bacterium]MCW8986973.1 hypothetical protein [Gammaproteobacteria bacterium]MCW9030923.1 hypothetical protein [Gammaproteobacteria bacterium]
MSMIKNAGYKVLVIVEDVNLLIIAMVAIECYMIIDVKNLDTLRILGITAEVLILAVAILAIRYGHTKFPCETKDDS